MWMIVSPANAGSVTIDTFRDAPASVYIYPLVHSGSWSDTYSDASVMGGERETEVTPVGPPTPPANSVKVVSSSGIDDGVAPTGALQVGTQDGYSAQVRLMYDGPDAEGLGGVDFTQNGTNDRVLFSFAWIASVGHLDTTITLTDTGGRQVTQDKAFADDGTLHGETVPFSDFVGDAGFSFQSVDSMEVLLNVAAVPNTDFAIEGISIIPEPASWSLMAMAALSFAVYRRRRRNGMAGNL
jgi:hypothetical protein